MKRVLKSIIISSLLISLLSSLFIFDSTLKVSAKESWPSGTVKTVAKSSCLIDYSTGTVLYEDDAHTKRYPASITKILTTLLTIENCKMSDEVTFSKNSISCIRDGAANIGAVPGEKMSVKDCLYGLMLQSGNECATALGEHMFGDEKTFAKKLNERAKKAGAKDSHFVNGNGLHNENHYVTAYDMAMIMRDALKYPIFRKIIGTTQYTINKNNKRKHRFISTMRHKMIWEGGPYYYKGIIGGKTGFTDQARNTLVTAAERNGLTLISVVLKSDTNNVYTDTKKLLDYGFDNFKSANISKNESAFKYQSEYNYKSPFIKREGTIKLDSSATVVIPKNASFSDLTASTTYDDNNAVAKINYKYGNKAVGSANVIYESPTSIKTLKTEEVKDIEKETTKKVSSTKKEKSTSFGDVMKIVLKVLVYVLIVAVVLVIILILYKRKKKLDKIREQKRNRYRSSLDE